MIENLARPWLLGRFVLGATEAALALVALVVAAQALQFAAATRTSASTRAARHAERALILEKRIELVSTLFALAAGFAWLDLFLAVLGADRLAGSIRGAMCAYGVLNASPWGFRSLALALIAALSATAWRAVHAADLTQREDRLGSLKLRLAFFVAPLVIASFVGSTAFALDLDFRVVASCCSTGASASAGAVLGREGSAETAAMFGLVAFGLVAAVAASTARFGAARIAMPATWVSIAASMLAAIAAAPAIVGYVAPHAYETPLHQCPFCLLRVEESGGVGWPLYVALAVALSSALSLVATEAVRGRAVEQDGLDALRRRYALATSVGWLAAVVAALYPVVRYLAVTGGAPLFG